MKPPKLKPCPFCGGRGFDEQGTDSFGKICYRIRCLTCSGQTGLWVDLQQAIRAWNRRAGGRRKATEIWPSLSDRAGEQLAALLESAFAKVRKEESAYAAQMNQPLPGCGHRAGCQHLGDETKGQNPAEVYCAACEAVGKERERCAQIAAGMCLGCNNGDPAISRSHSYIVSSAAVPGAMCIATLIRKGGFHE